MTPPPIAEVAPGAPQGPLTGVRVVEFAGLGPAPFAAMLLSDLGAEVLLVERADRVRRPQDAVIHRGRLRLPIDLKGEGAADTVLGIVEHADILIEGFRPGVMERLGLGPDVALKRNPALIYGRMTGWGQTGPYAGMAGHDINFIATSGALHAIGPAGRPVPPLNLVGDFGGGALYLALGLVSALLHARATGVGQVVDAAICDGSASLMAMLYGYRAAGYWADEREKNRLDGAAHYYGTYRCRDGRWIAIGSIEPQFYALLLRLLEIEDPAFTDQADESRWPSLRQALAERFASRDRADWCALLEGTDVCFAPVLSMDEAPYGRHNLARQTFLRAEGRIQPAPAPRFSRTPGAIQAGSEDEDAVRDRLRAWGCAFR